MKIMWSQKTPLIIDIDIFAYSQLLFIFQYEIFVFGSLICEFNPVVQLKNTLIIDIDIFAYSQQLFFFQYEIFVFGSLICKCNPVVQLKKKHQHFPNCTLFEQQKGCTLFSKPQLRWFIQLMPGQSEMLETIHQNEQKN